MSMTIDEYPLITAIAVCKDLGWLYVQPSIFGTDNLSGAVVV
ncbi:MAG: hypothetical protein ACKVOR_00595 [Flavobacteriales bacterium]